MVTVLITESCKKVIIEKGEEGKRMRYGNRWRKRGGGKCMARKIERLSSTNYRLT